MDYLVFDKRLGISVPGEYVDFDSISEKELEDFWLKWEKIRGTIPDRIQELDRMMEKLQTELSFEEDFEESCRLNAQIAELASIVNDLWLLYRVSP
ncbi:hypothetical protein [Falsibacillus pallidus]|uniref:hypothetical protein n=1 Tax=Falsibacillus pallidus TaxID=493781 RepID=UPI003D9910F1